MFLAPINAPGIHIERVLDTMDRFMAGGHAEIRLVGLRSLKVPCWARSALVFATRWCG
jgi:hypothetical protein